MDATLRELEQRLKRPFNGVGWDRMSTRLGVTLLVVSAIFFAANFADKAWLSYQVSQQKHQRLVQIAELQQQIQQYQGDLKYLHTTQYYVNAARPYGYVRQGDIQLQVPPISVTSVAPARAPEPVTQQHESLFGRLIQSISPGF